ncbi:hypothetical protein A2U01_0047681 [Trifolium medium]|uniref:Uncharacterized protein n=1 Tax=Trifolium medium TaxID=97028 RepID=A0A392QTC0_9FABA|nr:hypothetical protein [Trifolium medium]
MPEQQHDSHDSSDDDFHVDATIVVQNDIHLIRQAWADTVEQEQPFTQYISKQQKKKNSRMARSAGQPYQTRSKGAPPQLSL